MNHQTDVEAILDRFRDWFEHTRVEAERDDDDAAGSEHEPAERDFGIIDLVEEFTALRQELKLQTKSGRGLIEQTENTVLALRQAIDQFRSVEPKEGQAAWTAGKALAEALADLDEAMVRGEREIERARQLVAEESVRNLETAITGLFRKRSWIRRQFLRPLYSEILETVGRDAQARDELFDTFLEGYHLIQKRLRRAMASEQVVHLACEGKPVNPELMTVIELVDEPRERPGIVAKELRRGYTWRGRVIRLAEVQAVRAAWKSPAAPEGDMIEDDEMESEPSDFDSEFGEDWEPAENSTNGPPSTGPAEE